MNGSELPWVSVRDVCSMYGVTYETAKNKIHAGTFDVPTYKVGKLWVVDKHVHCEYFTRLREAGLQQLKTLATN